VYTLFAWYSSSYPFPCHLSESFLKILTKLYWHLVIFVVSLFFPSFKDPYQQCRIVSRYSFQNVKTSVTAECQYSAHYLQDTQIQCHLAILLKGKQLSLCKGTVFLHFRHSLILIINLKAKSKVRGRYPGRYTFLWTSAWFSSKRRWISCKNKGFVLASLVLGELRD
jgi:hypothetical protein